MCICMTVMVLYYPAAEGEFAKCERLCSDPRAGCACGHRILGDHL